MIAGPGCGTGVVHGRRRSMLVDGRGRRSWLVGMGAGRGEHERAAHEDRGPSATRSQVMFVLTPSSRGSR